MQLFAYLQELLAAHRLSKAQLQEDHQPGPESRHPARAHHAGHVPRHLWPLFGHVFGELFAGFTPRKHTLMLALAVQHVSRGKGLGKSLKIHKQKNIILNILKLKSFNLSYAFYFFKIFGSINKYSLFYNKMISFAKIAQKNCNTYPSTRLPLNIIAHNR